MPVFERDDVCINYEIHGDGIPVLLLAPGGMRSSISIWEEVQTILKNSNLDLNTLLTWACKNGAEFLQLKDLGTLEKGKRPGVNLVHKNKVQRLD